MKTMDYIIVDTLTASQLENDDMISIEDEIVRLISIEDGAGDTFILEIENDFGESNLIIVDYDDKFDLYMLM
jgi:hypothetical protein